MTVMYIHNVYVLLMKQSYIIAMYAEKVKSYVHETQSEQLQYKGRGMKKMSSSHHEKLLR